jgi:hypothetical protein
MTNGSQGVALYIYQGALSLYFDTPAIADFRGPAFPRDRWVCVQLDLDVSDTNGSFTLSIDGQSVLAQGPPLDTLPGAVFVYLTAGIDFSGFEQNGPARVYIDDVVVDIPPIACWP